MAGILARDPRQVDALHLSGILALQAGRLNKAYDLLIRALRVWPDFAAARADIGLVLFNLDRLDEAAIHLNKALLLQPDMAAGLVNLGMVEHRRAGAAVALSYYRRAIALQPLMAEAHNNLAMALLDLSQASEAVSAATEAVRLEPKLAEAYQTLGKARDHLGDFDGAVVAHRQAIALQPQSAKLHADLSNTLLSYGYLKETADELRLALRLDRRNGEWHQQLSHLVKHLTRDDDIVAMETLMAEPGLPDSERMQLSFGLGKALDDIGETGAAFAHFVVGNGLRRQNLSYDPAQTAAQFADVMESFDAAAFERHQHSGFADSTPIFVLGMPRSGTTLVEQVLASHHDISGAGELSLLSTLVGQLNQQPGALQFSQLVPRLDGASLRQLGQGYVRDLRAYGPTTAHVTDKMPGNFLLIGMIKLALPRARIVHVRRDPVDTCLSIYKNLFANSGLRYAYDLAEIGQYYQHYAQLMEHWRSVLPGFVYEVGYEALVGDQEGETRRLFDWLGLDWDPASLNFQDNARPVHTASNVQVRQPLYSSSIGQVGKYGEAVGPLLQALGLDQG